MDSTLLMLKGALSEFPEASKVKAAEVKAKLEAMLQECETDEEALAGFVVALSIFALELQEKL